VSIRLEINGLYPGELINTISNLAEVLNIIDFKGLKLGLI
jgi:hypothetical protein